jgi:hypothetical protein
VLTPDESWCCGRSRRSLLTLFMVVVGMEFVKFNVLHKPHNF